MRNGKIAVVTECRFGQRRTTSCLSRKISLSGRRDFDNPGGDHRTGTSKGAGDEIYEEVDATRLLFKGISGAALK